MLPFPNVAYQPETFQGPSQTIRKVGRQYQRKLASEFNDEPASLSPRQENFYRNLIGLARAIGSNTIPVEFEALDGKRYYMDRGCIKIAEHAEFVRRLRNDKTGTVGTITLTWDTSGFHRAK